MRNVLAVIGIVMLLASCKKVAHETTAEIARHPPRFEIWGAGAGVPSARHH